MMLGMLCLSSWEIGLISALGAGATGAFVKLGGEKWFPKLPPLDVPDPPTISDRLAYFGAHMLSLLIGVAAAALLMLLTPASDDPMRFSPYDRFGWGLGAGFVMLAVAGLVSPWLLERLVQPGPLLHLLHRGCRQFGGADWRPATIRLSLIVIPIALLVHFSIRSMHVTFSESVVRWCDWPWQSEQERAWSDVEDIRVVRYYVAPNGNVIDRPYLVIAFADGAEAVAGSGDTRPDGFWETPASYASERSGVPVRHVDK